MFRRATPDDIIPIARLVREFYGKVGYIYTIPFDHASCIETVETVVTKGVCMVGPSSCAGATICPYPWNYGEKLAVVLFWYFKKPREIKILDAIMTACREAGATHINVASHFPDNRIDRYYRKMGFTKCEIQSIARLK